MSTFIDKLALVHVHGRRLMGVRTCGQDVFYLPGGKREAGETDAQALARELFEELGVMLDPATLEQVGTYQAQAHGKPPGTMVRLTCYQGTFAGEAAPHSEIAEIGWLTHADKPRATIVGHQLMDDLYAQGLLD